VDNVKFDGSEVTLISNIKAQASMLNDQIPLIWRKDQALKDLSEKKKISKELYAELHSSFDGVLTQLKSEAQTLREEIEDEIAECNEEIKALNYALVNLEIEHEIGKVDNQYYETAFSMIQENIKRVHMKKTDLELMTSKLSSILLGDTSKPFEQTKGKIPEPPKPLASELPEPPVVVYVKEIGKTGI
jgi:chromosome segregation ATPase